MKPLFRLTAGSVWRIGGGAKRLVIEAHDDLVVWCYPSRPARTFSHDRRTFERWMAKAECVSGGAAAGRGKASASPSTHIDTPRTEIVADYPEKHMVDLNRPMSEAELRMECDGAMKARRR